MKEMLKQFADYHVWAQQKIFTMVLTQDEQLLSKKLSSSFDTIDKTLLHMWNAESVWWQRLERSVQVIRPDAETHNIRNIIGGLSETSNQLQQYVSNKSETELLAAIEYSNFAGQAFTQPICQILLHVFNHATYHRGQLVTMLHQIGVKDIAATDFIVWSRSC